MGSGDAGEGKNGEGSKGLGTGLTGGGDFELLDAVGPDGREDYRHFVKLVRSFAD